MRLAGSRTIQSVQEHMGASIYYNTNTRVAGRRIKYGVMAIDHLLRDLEQWETMYVAGRLQKPVRVVRDDARVRLAVGENRRGALRAAMLLLPGEFTEEELFTRVTGLSYVGRL